MTAASPPNEDERLAALAISRSLAQQMGFQLGVESEVGQGPRTP